MGSFIRGGKLTILVRKEEDPRTTNGWKSPIITVFASDHPNASVMTEESGETGNPPTLRSLEGSETEEIRDSTVTRGMGSYDSSPKNARAK